jgi:hypothetical protein
MSFRYEFQHREIAVMVNWRSALALSVGAVLIGSTALWAQGERKLNDTEKKEIQAIVKIVDGPAAGQPTSNDLGLTWVHNDLLKAQGNMQYVPFTVSVDTSKMSAKSLSLYWRVIAKNPPAETGGKDDKKNDKKKAFAYEDLGTIPVEGKSGPMTISRSFTVAPGAYDVLLVAKEPTSKEKNAPPPKMAMIHKDIEIANLWDGEFTTSTIIVAKSIEPLAAPLTPQQQADRPYAMGAMEIVPVFETKFNKQTELSTFMLIYNAKTDPANNKPDVTVEYNFYAKQAGGEKFFNKTNPQALNAQTLPPQFDFAAGHQLQSGQAVPLASFPEGDYRLEIKVIDKLADKTLMREINFSVSGS